LALSEVIPIVIHFHQMHFRGFKMYYLAYVRGHLRAEFPRAVSYQRSVELMAIAIGLAVVLGPL
jgi:hypothetical protein